MPRLETASSYDEVPYEAGLAPGAHPDRLATIARIFGIPAADPASCSVLEIGCAAANNLLPMAYCLPNSQFVGIDPAPRQIEMGQAFLREYGVTNVELHALDVREILGWDRKFDYIICHGVFSWVAEDVQDAILEACRRLLAPNGVAYVSYNTLPGFHTRAPIREMLRFHASHFVEPTERAGQARSLLSFLVEATEAIHSGGFNAYHQMLKSEHDVLATLSDSYVIHEHLSESNDAFYLYEFVELAAEHDLQYLGDAAFHTMMVKDLPNEVGEKLGSIASTQVALEQYRDFVVNRTFRKTLLCHRETTINREVTIEALRGLLYRKLLLPTEEGDWVIPKPGGARVQVNDLAVRSVLSALAQAAPRALTLAELGIAAGEIMGAPLEEKQTGAIVLSLLSLEAVDARTWAPDVATEVGKRPSVFEPARRMPPGRRGAVPLPQHGFARLDAIVAAMLHLVDGTRTLAELADAIEDEIQRGVFVIDGVAQDEMPAREDLDRLVPECLSQLLDVGLLIAP